MSVAAKIVTETAGIVYAQVSEEDRKQCSESHFASKVSQALDLLLSECRAEGAEKLRRCLNPDRREAIQVKHAVRRAVQEEKGESVGFNFVRNYVAQIEAAVNSIPSRYPPKEILDAIVEAGFLPAPAKPE